MEYQGCGAAARINFDDRLAHVHEVNLPVCAITFRARHRRARSRACWWAVSFDLIGRPRFRAAVVFITLEADVFPALTTAGSGAEHSTRHSLKHWGPVPPSLRCRLHTFPA